MKLSRVLITLANVPKGTDGPAVIPSRCFEPYDFRNTKRLWIITDPNYTIDQDPIHHKNAFLEDRMHDWDVDREGIRYFGTGRGSKHLTLLVEIKESI